MESINTSSKKDSVPTTAVIVWKDTQKDGFVPFERLTGNSTEMDAKRVKKDDHFKDNLADGWSGQFIRKIAASGAKPKDSAFEEGQHVYSRQLNDYVQVKSFEKDEKDP